MLFDLNLYALPAKYFSGVVYSVNSLFCWVKFNMYKFVHGYCVPFIITFPLYFLRIRTDLSLMWLHIHDRTMFLWTAGPYWALEEDVLFVLESSGPGEKGLVCEFTWWFPRLEFGWGADGQPVVYCRMAGWESDNVLSFSCPLLLGYPLFVQV